MIMMQSKRHYGLIQCFLRANLILGWIFLVSMPVFASQWRQFEYGGRIKCMASNERYIWVGGENGALRYDLDTGRFLSIEREINNRGDDVMLSGSIVRAIAIDPKGRTFFACWEQTQDGLVGTGITMMGAVGYLTISEQDGLPSNDVYSLCADSQGRIWAGTKDGIALLDEGRISTFTTDDGLFRNDAVEISVDQHDRVWSGFWRGVNVYRDGYWWSWERNKIDYVYSIIPGPDNKVYCATKGGIAVYDGERWEMVRLKGDLRKRLISDMALDRDGNIWCAWGGLDKGVSIFDGQDWSRVTRKNSEGGLAGNRSIAIETDRDGRIWIGDRMGHISVMTPDGVPELPQGELLKTSAAESCQPFRYAMNRPRGMMVKPDITQAFAKLMRLRWTSASLSLGLLNSQNQSSCISKPIKEQDFADLEWEPPLDEAAENVCSPEFEATPVLLAQAGGAAPTEIGAAIQINVPADLNQSTKDNPYQAVAGEIDIGVGIMNAPKLAYVEINGFKGEFTQKMEMSGINNMYLYQGKVLLEDIDTIHVEIFDEDEQSAGFKDFPIAVSGPKAEMQAPSLVFIHPKGITEEKMVAARGGGVPIEVQLTTANNATVRGLVHDDTGIKLVRINGKQADYFVDAPPSQLAEAGLEGMKNIKYFEHQFELGTGNNQVQIEAVDVFDNVARIMLELAVQARISDSEFYGGSYAMIVGINAYDHWQPLENAVHDARGIKNLLLEKFEFPEDHIYEAYDANATKEGIVRAFQQVSKAPNDSRVIIFFAGHGQTTDSRRGKQGYLIPVDGAFCLSNKPNLEELQSWISMQEISDQIGYFDAKHILLILDACYSGLMTATRGSSFGTALAEDAAVAEFVRLAETNAVEVITAGTEEQQVLDGGRDGHSIFTGAILDGLEKGEADIVKDGVITSQELGTYVFQTVYGATSKRQSPKYAKLPGYEDESGLVLFPIAGKG